ncbi:MAG: hypothetical protein R3Y15_01395 [Rikenellaceae bacterium]
MVGAVIIEGHVQGLSNVRSLGEKGIPVYVIDVCHCLAQHSRYCKKYLRCPAFNSPEFIEFLINLALQEKLEGWVLIPSNDHIVENLSRNKDRLMPYFKTIVPEQDILNNIVNKKRLIVIANDCETPTPKTCYPENKHETKLLTFPVLIKGSYGLSFYKKMHAKAIQADSLDDLDYKLYEVLKLVEPNDIIIQELLPYDKQHGVVSFTCFAQNGEIKSFWMGKKLREHPIRYGTATYSESIYNEDILNQAKPLIMKLKYTGVCEVEFMRDMRDGVYKLIEVNPRTWLWVELARACGVDYAYMIYAHLNNIEFDYASDYCVGLKWINWFTDFVYGLKAMCNNDLKISEYLSSLKGKKINAIWSGGDMKPGLMYPILLFHINKRRR